MLSLLERLLWLVWPEGYIFLMPSCAAQIAGLGNYPGAPTPGRLLALRDVLLGFLSGSKHTVHLDAPSLVHVPPGAHFFPDLPSSRAT